MGVSVRFKYKKKTVLVAVLLLVTVIAAFYMISKKMFKIIADKFYAVVAEHTLEIVETLRDAGISKVENDMENTQKFLQDISDQYAKVLLGGDEALKRKIIEKIPLPEYGYTYTYYNLDGSYIRSDGTVGSWREDEVLSRVWEKEAVIQGPYINEEGSYVVIYSTTVFQQGLPSGRLSLEKDACCFSEIISDIQFTAGEGVARIINGEGIEIAVSREEKRDRIGQEYHLQEGQETGTESIEIGDLEKLVLNGGKGIASFNIEDEIVYIAYAPLGKADWVFLVNFYGGELRSYTETVVVEGTARNQLFLMFMVVFLCLAAIVVFWRTGKEKQEKMDIIRSLASMYSRIFTVDIEKNQSVLIYVNGMPKKNKARKLNFDEVSLGIIEKQIHPDDRNLLLPVGTVRNLKQILTKEKQLIQVEYRINSGEEQKWEHEDILVLTWNKEKPASVLMAVRDVSEQKIEDQKVADTLRDTLELAKSANEAKSDFLSRMSHDIRTPMNAVIGMTGIAEANAEDSTKVRECLKKISISSKHLLNLINDVLDMSKLESGKVNLLEEDFDLVELTETLLALVQQSIEEKKHVLTVNTEGVVHKRVIGDSVRIQQIFVNIMGNAVKYTPPLGSISLKISERPTNSPRIGFFKFVFEDNGIGMTEEFAEHIFEPFTRAEDSRINKVEGTGLGMAITQNIVRMMNGTIKVESRPEEGTKITVEICLKLQNTTVDDIIAEPSKEAEHEEAFDSLKGRRVLVVEDNELNMEITTEVLKGVGILTETAYNGREALDMLTSSGPGYYDLILMDIQMPVMNGFEATKAIRKLERKDLSRLPILAMTANAFMEDIKRTKEAGMDEHITKPFDTVLLIRTLEKWIRQDY